ncbi:hypothetical protein HPC49_46550 [Pyxidicoccus fallax]|uniref:Uncharacterized protein n=1 Tax=Pyxidicoccus fallax TaxID=394095 RepID=A0A848LWQ0_9BACT|nr:hypothetical protein [Pyxidicoccus fallax]NMO21982.1 hypothetical protein [Pyxidicoccus fallax]NPC85638.1 hypothetical protein [Pyxidicoccus fallax]
MPDIKDPRRMIEPSDDEMERQGTYEEEGPGHTPGSAEGDDEEAPHRMHPYEDPDKTPGSAEGD